MSYIYPKIVTFLATILNIHTQKVTFLGILFNIYPKIVTFLGIIPNIYPKIVTFLGIMLYLTMSIEYNTRKNQIFEYDTHIMLNMPNTH
jgi:hypothetical protein